MSYLAFGLNRRRKTAELRRTELGEVVSPPSEHPVLGVAGRSMELSLSLGKPASADAILLAAEALDDFVKGLRDRGAEHDLTQARSALALLKRAAAGVELSGAGRDLLTHVEREIASLE